MSESGVAWLVAVVFIALGAHLLGLSLHQGSEFTWGVILLAWGVIAGCTWARR